MNINRKLFEVWVFQLSCIVFPIYTVLWISQHLHFTELFYFWLANFFLGIHVTIFMHRAWTHHAWRPSRLLNLWGLFVYTLGFSSPTIGWAAIHREHHRHSDTILDPHSPYYVSRWKILFGAYTKVKLEYAQDLLRDYDHLQFYKYYWHIQLTWYTIIYLLNPSLLWAWFAILGFHGFKMRLINVIGHNGIKTHTNSPLFAYLYLHGEPWHGNHHEDPKSWRFGKYWYQIDLGAQLIKLFVKLRIAKARI